MKRKYLVLVSIVFAVLLQNAQAATSLPDLVVTSITTTPTNPVAGSTYTMSITVKNQGTIATSKAQTVQISFSGLSYYKTGASSIAAGASETVTFDNRCGNINPIAYTITADYNNVIPESNDNNNQSSTTVNPAAPDLVVTSIITTPTNPAVGSKFTAVVTVKNQGTASAQSSEVSFPDNAFYGYITTVWLSSIEKSASQTITVPSLTCNSGNTCTAVADFSGKVTESNESNNRLQITFNSPDLVVTSITTTPTSPVIGSTFTATVTVKNQGAGATPKAQTVRLLCPNNTSCDGTGAGSIAVGASEIITISNVPCVDLASKTYMATADIYNVIAESNENNNQRPITIVPSYPPDLIVTSITTTPTNPVIGSTFTAVVTVKNQGAGPTTSRQTVTLLCQNSTSYGISGALSIAAGASEAVTFNNVPCANLASMTYTATADGWNGIKESNENNNQLSITLTPSTPDLIVTNITLSPEPPVIGATKFTAYVTVKNQGNAIANIFDLKFSGPYITDNTIANDSCVKFVDVIAPNESRIISITGLLCMANVNQGQTRTYTAEVDSYKKIIESNENNNSLSTTVTPAGPDLVVDYISIPPFIETTASNWCMPAALQKITVNIKISNKGNKPATNIECHMDALDWKYANFALYNGLWDKIWTIPSLAAGASTIVTYNFPAPIKQPSTPPNLGTYTGWSYFAAYTEGKFYVRVLVDYQNVNQETNEANNRRLIPVTPIYTP